MPEGGQGTPAPEHAVNSPGADTCLALLGASVLPDPHLTSLPHPAAPLPPSAPRVRASASDQGSAPWVFPPPRIPLQTPPEMPLRKALLDPGPGTGPHCRPRVPAPAGSDAPVPGLACFPAVSPLGWKPPKGQAKCGTPLTSPLRGGSRGGGPLQTPLDNRHHEGTAVGGGLPAPTESLPGPDVEPPSWRPWGLGVE